MSSREKCETWHFSRLRLQTTSEKCFKKRTLKKLTAFSGLETWPKQPDVLKSHQEKDAPQRKDTICGNSVFVTFCLGWSKVVGDPVTPLKGRPGDPPKKTPVWLRKHQTGLEVYPKNIPMAHLLARYLGD